LSSWNFRIMVTKGTVTERPKPQNICPTNPDSNCQSIRNLKQPESITKLS
jgi:hypothetical protein